MKRSILVVMCGLWLIASHAALRGQEPTDPAPASAALRSVLDGVYTADQARRGARTSGHCAECHGSGFSGGLATTIKSSSWVAAWSGRTVGDLFELIRRTMPDDDPGSMSRQEYADIIAYILAVNRFPAGDTELGTDLEALKLLRIDATKP